jgi:hypothetical protein
MSRWLTKLTLNQKLGLLALALGARGSTPGRRRCSSR